MNPLLEQFLQEARENLAFIDQNIGEIGGDDPELLNSVFRAAHTLKGGSGIVGFESVKEITHHAEDLLDMLRSGKLEFQPYMIEALYNAFDEVLNLVEAAEDSEDIVTADPATVEQIIAQLTEAMGKTNLVVEWEPPFEPIPIISPLVNLPLAALCNNKNILPFKIAQVNKNVCESRQLYGILFDIDQSSMVFGNDPIYALSLLGDQVVAMHVCMNENSAKETLSGMEDPDGLLLRCQITAYIYATYMEIEDTLFNFLDEIQIGILDIATLLSIDEGARGLKLDVLKELNSTVKIHLESKDKSALKSEIEKTLPLLGKQTIQYYQLNRLLSLINSISSDDLPRLGTFFRSLNEGEAYMFDPDQEVSDEIDESAVVVVEKESLTPFAGMEEDEDYVDESLLAELEDEDEILDEEAEIAEAFEIDQHIEHALKVIYEQQLQSLGHVSTQEGVERVRTIIEGTRKYYPDMPSSLEDVENLTHFIKVKLGLEEAKIVAPVQKSAEAKPEVGTPKAEVIAPKVEAVKSAPAKVASSADSDDQDESSSGGAKESSGKKSVVGKTVKIEQESIDNLMNIVGELLVAKNSLPYLAEGVGAMNKEMIARAIMEKYTFINRLSEQLQDLIMSMRMLPISYVFDRYPKLVRDISKKLGKKVNLIMDGGETTLDKNMIEMLADPMIHIMRNSLDHGIEMPEDRVNKGKNAEGSVHLKAYPQSDKIIIEIKDDGNGINVARVAEKVVSKGLMTQEQVDELSESEKAELVLIPGLSTVDTITEFSGRGVGMDVVKKSIEGFGGTIRIHTKANEGTLITLAIPVSLAVTSLLHIYMDNIHYGIPMDNVNETVKIKRSEIEYLHNEPFVYIRGEVIPLLFIKSMLDESSLDNNALSIVVLEVKGNLIAVVVNEFLGQLDVVQKPLEGIMEGHQLFSGTALLGNGQIIIAIDPLGILSIAHRLKEEMEKKAS
jgi:two-component system, chemotaxis family, sensor kinase CheA